MEASKHSADLTDTANATPVPLSAYVTQTLERYFAQLKDHDAVNLHAMVMGEVEKPLLEAALSHAGHNQTKTAKILGLSRSTLRKKLEHYGIS
ncbi:MAG: helix-turn-helix domain-containing protein [Methylovulum sp.]|nr:helix-turn-helix domain-containing protein [Methylovulum sp.]